MPPPSTEVGIREASSQEMDRFSMLATRRPDSRTEIRLKAPQELKSQKFTIGITCFVIFIFVEEVDIFQGVETFAAF